MNYVRRQVQFEPDQYEALQREASQASSSVSALVREAVAIFLMGRRTYGRQERERLLRFVGAYEDSKRDVSRRHDGYLHGSRGR